MRILVTGAEGSIGKVLVPDLALHGYDVVPTDVDSMDVTVPEEVRAWCEQSSPDVIMHLAADKHAPIGEVYPRETTQVNYYGTQNVIDYANGARVIFASTCKACNPETVYGASKLIAERLVLNAGGVVVRFYNVCETAGNVFRIWEETPEDQPILYTDCWRYFISINEAMWLLKRAMELPTGRYVVDPGSPVYIPDLAAQLYPDRERVEIPRRRGDRYREPLIADSETRFTQELGIFRVESPHDL